MNLKMNLLGGAISYLKDLFNKERDYSIPLTMKENVGIDILIIEDEDELMPFITSFEKWRGFWYTFSLIVDNER